MTNRLYYTDPYSTEFDATITRVDRDNGRTRITLDRTHFYPTSGGQPFDTGEISGHAVVDVVDQEDEEVAHILTERSDRPAVAAGQQVHGAIDWVRRFDHMQQHTGQHVLSAAFDRLFDARTIGFHLGADLATIDLARELTPRDLTAAEIEANRIVWENRPVTIRFATADDAARLPLRKESLRTGTLRLIDIEQFDLSACGGTHVAHTGEIGAIAISAWERFKGGQRLTFYCGARALNRMRAQRDTLASASRLLSVSSADLSDAIERLQGELKDRKREAARLQLDLTRYQAEEFAAAASAAAGARIVLRAIDADANTLKALASALAARGGLIAVLLSTSRPALVVVSRSPNIGVAANEVLARLTATFGGRGGGNAEFAQGGGLNGESDAILQEAHAAIVKNS